MNRRTTARRAVVLAMSAGLTFGLLTPAATAEPVAAPATKANDEGDCKAFNGTLWIGDEGYVKYYAAGFCKEAELIKVQGTITKNKPSPSKLIALNDKWETGKKVSVLTSSKPDGFKDKPGKQQYCAHSEVAYGIWHDADVTCQWL